MRVKPIAAILALLLMTCSLTQQRMAESKAAVIARPLQTGAELGPKDGRDLPPADLDRVKVGSEAPDFSLEDQEGRVLTLSAFRGKKAVVLIFYRGRW